MEREYSYIYGFADEIKDNWKDTVLSCFYIGKQTKRNNNFERGYEHLNPKKEKNHKRYKQAKCFVIAIVPPMYDLSNVEKYFTELIQPELNILNNPSVNGKNKNELLYKQWDEENLIDRLNFYVFDIKFLKESRWFSIGSEIERIKERDDEFRDCKIIPYETILQLSADAIFELFGYKHKILVEGNIKEKIAIYNERIITCKLEKGDYSAFLSSDYNRDTFEIYRAECIGSYKGHRYEVVSKSVCARCGLNGAIKYVRDYPNDVPLTKEELKNIVLEEQEMRHWFNYFTIKYHVYYSEIQSNDIGDNRYRNHSDGNNGINRQIEGHFNCICALINNNFPEFSKKFTVSRVLHPYRYFIDESIPNDSKLLYYLGIMKNICLAAQKRFYKPRFYEILIKNENMTIIDFIKRYDRIGGEKFEDELMERTVNYFQAYTDNEYAFRSEYGKTFEDIFITFRDISWAVGYLTSLKQYKNKKQQLPYWITKEAEVEPPFIEGKIIEF